MSLPNKTPRTAIQGEKGVKQYAHYSKLSSRTTDIVALAHHFGLTLNKARTDYMGPCPLCQYGKATCCLKNTPERIVVCCFACRRNIELFNLFRAAANSDNRANSVSARVQPVSYRSPIAANRAGEQAETIKKRNYAFQLYGQSIPLKNTLGEVYFQHRGFGHADPTCKDAPLCLPDVLRFMPRLAYGNGQHYPAIVAPITDVQGRFLAVHRTYLARDGKGKATVDTPKKTLGSFSGGSIKLAPAEDTLLLAEGIETALAAMAFFAEPAWACVCTGGMERVALPALPLAQKVIIVADNDLNGAGMKSARVLETRLLNEGRQVRVIYPNTPDTDMADYLLKGGEAW